jgi:hypothetical protein
MQIHIDTPYIVYYMFAQVNVQYKDPMTLISLILNIS